jgi:D-alanine transaminase
MSRIAYVNGSYVPHRHAMVHIEDRGYQFADGIYEVVGVVGGRLIDEALHLDRLDRSLHEVSIAPPMSRAALRFIMGEVIRRNQIRNGMVYMQITRGVAPRDHVFPAHAKPVVVITAKRIKPTDPKIVARGVDVISLPDMRWKRCDIKSVSLLPNVLAKQTAKKKGAYEAWLMGDDGLITEGTSTNAWIVTRKGALVTRPADVAILNGVTRRSVLRLAEREGLAIEERKFTLKEALAAREAFITSTTNYVMPVVRIDGKPIGDGKPGSFSKRLRSAYIAYMDQMGEGAPVDDLTARMPSGRKRHAD